MSSEQRVWWNKAEHTNRNWETPPGLPEKWTRPSRATAQVVRPATRPGAKPGRSGGLLGWLGRMVRG